MEPALVPVRLDISRTTGDGYALRLRFEATLVGPVHALPGAGRPDVRVDAREVSAARADADDELARRTSRTGCSTCAPGRATRSRCVLPTRSCAARTAPGCAPVCGANLNEAGPDHAHEREPDPRWAELSRAALRVGVRGDCDAGWAARCEAAALAAVAGRDRGVAPRAGRLHCLAPWPSPSRSSPTRGPRSVARSTRSARRRTTPARSATALACRTGSARCAAATRGAR